MRMRYTWTPPKFVVGDCVSFLGERWSVRSVQTFYTTSRTAYHQYRLGREGARWRGSKIVSESDISK